MLLTSRFSLARLALAFTGIGWAVSIPAHDQLDDRRGSPVFDTGRVPTRTGLTGECIRSEFRTPGDAASSCNPPAPVARAVPAAAPPAPPPAAPVQDFVTQPDPPDLVPVPPMTAETVADDRMGEPVWYFDEDGGKPAADGILATTENPDYAAEVAAADAAMNRPAEPPVVPAPQAAAPPPAPVAAPVPEKAAAPARPPVERVVLDADTLFAFNKATLTPEGQRTLDQVAANLAAGDFEMISITGHTDRIGTKPYNAKLSERRAQTVRRYLAEKGVDPKRMEARGVGSTQPVTGNQCDAIKKWSPLVRCLQPDRRVDIQVVAMR